MRSPLLTLIQHRSVQTFLLLALYLLLAPFLPDRIHQSFYTLSLFIKDLLLWMLPITVGLFIAHAIASFEKRAPLFILTLFLFEAFSNASSVWYSYACGLVATNFLNEVTPFQIADSFTPLWRLGLQKPAWWSADKGSFMGLVVGVAIAFKSPLLRRAVASGKETAEWILTRVFSRLIPLFILGFVARMYKLNLLNQMATQYAGVVVWLIAILVIYILALFLVGSGFSKSTFLKSIKNLLPATGVAFSSGCSLSTMPWTIEGTSKNLKNPELAKAIIPATTNIQQIGDCIANTFLCFLIYYYSYGEAPSFSMWVPFSAVFVLARFATAAVIGGAIFIMLPIYEAYLHFTPEMIAIILAFNVVLDPIITCSNVIANGALCRIFERVWGFIQERLKGEKKPVEANR
jgi:hypothetical protein